MNMYPRPVRDVHQIEITTRCNLRCQYCPHFPKLPRPMVDIKPEVYEHALGFVSYFVKKGTQTELSLTGIGESLLHPGFVRMVHRARETIGPDRRLTITTNGILLDDQMCAAIASARPSVFISLHRPEKAGHAIEAAKKHGILAGVNNSFATAAFNWAGTQKNWFVSAPKITCEFLRSGWCVVLVDGRVTTCCLDPDGSGVIGSIYDDPASLMLKPWGDEQKGCGPCHMVVP